jgi:hypothetical protein
MYPAKYSFDSNTLNCASATEPDYVVYNTSVAGATGGQASVIAFDNIYTTTCTPSTAVPTVYWSYNTGGERYPLRSLCLRMDIRLPSCSPSAPKLPS